MIINRNLRLNYGVEIRGKGGSFDVILRGIEGSEGCRTAILEVRGLEVTSLTLNPSDGLVRLTNSFYAGVLDISRRKGREVPMKYDIPPGYICTRRKYS